MSGHPARRLLPPVVAAALLVVAVALLLPAPASAGCPFARGLRFADDRNKMGSDDSTRKGSPSPSPKMAGAAAAPRPLRYEDNPKGRGGRGKDDNPKPHSHGGAAKVVSSPSMLRTNQTRRGLKGLIGLGVNLGLDLSLTVDLLGTTVTTSLMPTPATTPYTTDPYGTATNPINPARKDWVSVVSACRAVGLYEKRFNNFAIRAAFHDGLAVAANCPMCSGLDASLLVNTTEIMRAENAYESFALTVSRAVLKISRWFKVSAADVLAVCGAVATRTLGGPNIINPPSGATVFKVGRLDNPNASPAGVLPASDMTLDGFVNFWTARGFTVEQGVALMGSHALLDEQGCYRGTNNNPRDYCNPAKELCQDVRMFKWANHYFVDGCTPNTKVVPNTLLPEFAAYEADNDADIIRKDTPDEFVADLRREICKWSSNQFRSMAQSEVLEIRAGRPVIIPPKDNASVFWDQSMQTCKAHPNQAVKDNCNHPLSWWYTVNDGYLAEQCQAATPATSGGVAVKAAMTKYLNPTAWATDYPVAYRKMVDTYATYRLNPATRTHAVITGTECWSGYSTNNPSLLTAVTCSALLCPAGPRRALCPAGCRCKTEFNAAGWGRSLAADPDKNQLPGTAPSQPTTWTPPTVGEPTVGNTPVPIVSPDAPGTAAPAGGVPPSPYGTPDKICPAADGAAYRVDGYPGSPFVVKPFAATYKAPPAAVPVNTVCRDPATAEAGAGRHCLVTYNLTVRAFTARPWDATMPGCASKPATNLMGYDGMVPGPTITAPVGHEVMVRFNNDISGPAFTSGQPPCNAGGRTGRPIAVHLHGSASLAPYDGWADDVICTGEAKEYVYPNQRPTSAWYHDHGIHVTGENAYYGQAGWYIMSAKKKHGGCGEPFNLENIPEKVMMLSDQVVDSNCQLYYDHSGPHRNNLYGDINTINGVPFPDIPLGANWQRFRFVNAAMARPYLIKVKTAAGVDVGPQICRVIASDGGYRPDAITFPAEGLLIGVSERYEMVCDFTAYAGQQLYLWNGRNTEMMKAVPYFCYSHLLARISVAATAETVAPGVPAGVFDATMVPPMPSALTKVLSDADIATAKSMIAQKTAHRTFKFGRRNGLWVINGETWDSMKIAADDVGQNTWELWRITTGGGWFHPIHMHLVDFFVLQRNDNTGTDGLFAYERMVPKDVVYLGPGQDIYMIARFGAHRGMYMFHCHNLVHEDYDMLRAMNVVTGPPTRNPSSTLPIQQISGVFYSNYADPMGNMQAASVTRRNTALTPAYSAGVLNQNMYRIFYPGTNDPLYPNLKDGVNPWYARTCPLPTTTTTATATNTAG